MVESLPTLIEQYGVLLVLAIVFVEQIGVPVPALPVLMVAGAVAAGSDLSALAVFFAALSGCLAGDLIWYAAGRWRGHRILRLLCRVSMSPDTCVRQTEDFFGRWGVGALVIAKFVPGLSTIAPPLAGAMRLGTGAFLLFNGIGAAVWAGSGIVAGWLLHAQIEALLVWLGRMGGYAAMATGALLAAWIGWKWWERHRFVVALRGARIGVDELYQLMEQGQDPVVLDVRTPSARELDKRVIPGARFIDLSAPDQHLASVPPHRDIIVYCS
jgi:membrane protein DedA with SNARE-associated domain